MNPQNFGQKVIDFHFNMDHEWKLPDGVELLYPFIDSKTQRVFSQFYDQYFSDSEKRHFIFGINPGRFGAGVTGIPFTDPKILQTSCGIENDFKQKNELSAIFVYDFINALGGIQAFYSKFYITSVCPLGFVKEGKNYNYYDDALLYKSVENHIIKSIENQKSFGSHPNVAFCMGKGKNFKFFQKLNNQHRFFDKIVPLPHPRWVMQYRLKSKEEHIDKYVSALSSVI